MVRPLVGIIGQFGAEQVGKDIPEPMRRVGVIGKNTPHTLVYLFALQNPCLWTVPVFV
jgi:hypothetical protein